MSPPDKTPSRYKNVSRSDLPKKFWANPAKELAEMAAAYRQTVFKVDQEAANTHHDWAVRVELDPDASIPVTKAGVAHKGQWVEFRGVVQRVNLPVPLPISLAWVCTDCNNVTMTDPDTKLRACPCKSFKIHYSEELSKFIDSQHVLLSEHYEDVVGTRPPRSLPCRLDGTLIQRLSPGDHCVVGGVMRLRQVKKSGYDYELLVNNTMPFREVKEVDPPVIKGDPLDALVESFAPSVYGNRTIKESIILLQVGGSKGLEGRTDINVLLVGDPGIAKSTLLLEAAKVAPLGRYTSGRGSTAAGLTAGLAKDKDGTMYIEAGATVLTDTGVLCVDEFDKMTEKDRTSLHEVMEQQQTSIAKLGFLVTMKARVSMLAAANPKESYWDDDKTLAENIDLPQTLLTRFDLIYNLRDVPDADTDGMIADRILSGKKPDVLPPEAITAYITSVRPLKPTMSAEAKQAIRQYYIRARLEPGEIRITPRQVEAVKRLAGARAKIYQRKEITSEDATRAIFMVEHMIQKTMEDPVTGKPDHMKAVSGKSRSAVRQVDEAVTSIEGEFTATDLADKVKLSVSDTERALEHLCHRGIVVETSPNVYERAR